MALSPSYHVFVAARVVTGLVSSFSQTVPPSTIADIFVKEVRGSKMSMYAVAIVTAPAIAPVFCGLITHSHSWRICFWLITGLAVLQLLLFFFIVPETQWVIDEPASVIAMHSQAIGDSKKAGDEFFEMAPGDMRHAEVGHTGVTWYPWQRPREFCQLIVGPILMVSTLPDILGLPVGSLSADYTYFHLLWIGFCMVCWHHHCDASKVRRGAVQFCDSSSWMRIPCFWYWRSARQVVRWCRWRQGSVPL